MNATKNKYEVIGTDVSIDVCIGSGYGIIKYQLDNTDKIKDNEVIFYSIIPSYEDENIVIWKWYQPNIADSIEAYQENKAGVDGFIGASLSENPEDYRKTPGNFLELIDVLQAYCGYLEDGYPYKRTPKKEFLADLYDQKGY